ncbi:MAG: LytR/AlgR family response regulator transcription factor [Selenomonas massiliensis]|uniref:LytR/AlgR family response regulator transcription factor n=1 Tax=Selenomonas massiliensis TaxID=2058293 RepID=UPI000D10BE6B|nr:response regulator [Selenomonas massiliensis]
MRIAIVDDEPEVCAAVRDYLIHILEKYWEKKGSLVEIDLFGTAEAVLDAFEHSPYDLLLLDIRMPGIGGMEAARRIRAKNQDVGIIFLTSSEEYLMEGYRVFADGYFLKPVSMDEEAFRTALARVFERRLKAARVIQVHYNGQPFEILLHKIYYVDLEGGRLHIALAKQGLCLTRPYTYEWAVEQLGRDPRFLECYHRILVNMDKIDRMDKEAFVLTNGAELPISQRRRSSVRASYMQYLLNK